MQLDGQFEKVLCKCVEAESIQLLALHLQPADKAVNGELLNLMRACKAAILLYR
jgi:hypothetical protein